MTGVVGIILMGGTGNRFGSDVPKQFHRLSGKKIYLHTLEKFLNTQLFEEILLVTHENWMETVQSDLTAYQDHPIRVVLGGSSRQESSLFGLLSCPPNTHTVVIHDSVRPFISEEIIKKMLNTPSLMALSIPAFPHLTQLSILKMERALILSRLVKSIIGGKHPKVLLIPSSLKHT